MTTMMMVKAAGNDYDGEGDGDGDDDGADDDDDGDDCDDDDDDDGDDDDDDAYDGDDDDDQHHHQQHHRQATAPRLYTKYFSWGRGGRPSPFNFLHKPIEFLGLDQTALIFGLEKTEQIFQKAIL